MWFWNRGLVKDALPLVERFRRDTGVGVAALPHGPEAGASAAAPVERRCERGVSRQVRLVHLLHAELRADWLRRGAEGRVCARGWQCVEF